MSFHLVLLCGTARPLHETESRVGPTDSKLIIFIRIAQFCHVKTNRIFIYDDLHVPSSLEEALIIYPNI